MCFGPRALVLGPVPIPASNHCSWYRTSKIPLNYSYGSFDMHASLSRLQKSRRIPFTKRNYSDVSIHHITRLHRHNGGITAVLPSIFIVPT